MTELNRIATNKLGEMPPKVGLKVSARTETGPEDKLRMVSEIATTIATVNSRKLTDDEWKNALPDWFVSSMVNKSLEEIKANEELWHFGSWIDAIHQRGWTWWSSQVEENQFTVYLEALTYPYNIDPFVYIIYSTGVERRNIIVEEML